MHRLAAKVKAGAAPATGVALPTWLPSLTPNADLGIPYAETARTRSYRQALRHMHEVPLRADV